MNGVDDLTCVLRRQRYFTIYSEGKDWQTRPDETRLLNLEFVPDDVAPHIETATFVGSVRGCDMSDSGVCASLHMLHRLFSELRCTTIVSIVMEVQHKFRTGPSSVEVDEPVIGLMLRPQDVGLLEHYRDLLGICGQCRRVVS